MMDSGKIFEKLLHLAVQRGIVVRFAPLRASYARIAGDRIAIRQEMSIEEINHNLAHELAHAYLHYDKGVVMGSACEAQYEEQAERTAELLIDVLSA